MKFFAIHAYDELYNGLHGMGSFEIAEGESIDDVIVDAIEMAWDILSSYSQIVDELEETIKEECEFAEVPYGEGTNEEEDIRYEIYSNDLAYDVWELDKEKLPTEDLRKLDEMFSYDPENFLELYRKDND